MSYNQSNGGHVLVADTQKGIPDEQFQVATQCESADGRPITTWKLLRSMVEHEVHHRGELYAYLGLLGLSVPPLYGLTSEQLKQLADRGNEATDPG